MLVLIDNDETVSEEMITLQCSRCGKKHKVPLENDLNSCNCEND